MTRPLPRRLESPSPLVTDMVTLGRLVRDRRAQSAMRIDDAADLLGVSKDTLSRLENGRSVGLEKVFKVLNGFGLNLLLLDQQDASIALKQWQQSVQGSPDELRDPS
jgi:transcriptional regulator with XRE-family HTH domain